MDRSHNPQVSTLNKSSTCFDFLEFHSSVCFATRWAASNSTHMYTQQLKRGTLYASFHCIFHARLVYSPENTTSQFEDTIRPMTLRPISFVPSGTSQHNLLRFLALCVPEKRIRLFMGRVDGRKRFVILLISVRVFDKHQQVRTSGATAATRKKRKSSVVCHGVNDHSNLLCI